MELSSKSKDVRILEGKIEDCREATAESRKRNEKKRRENREKRERIEKTRDKMSREEQEMREVLQKIKEVSILKLLQILLYFLRSRKTSDKVCRTEAWTFVCRKTRSSFNKKVWSNQFNHQTTSFVRRRLVSSLLGLISHNQNTCSLQYTNSLSCFHIRQPLASNDQHCFLQCNI